MITSNGCAARELSDRSPLRARRYSRQWDVQRVTPEPTMLAVRTSTIANKFPAGAADQPEQDSTGCRCDEAGYEPESSAAHKCSAGNAGSCAGHACRTERS